MLSNFARSIFVCASLAVLIVVNAAVVVLNEDALLGDQRWLALAAPVCFLVLSCQLILSIAARAGEVFTLRVEAFTQEGVFVLNPVLLFLGYHFYIVNTGHRLLTLVSWGGITQGQEIEAVKLTASTYLHIKG